MTDHRQLQRALFRMQIDPRFRDAVIDGDARATAQTGLSAEDLRLLRRAPRAAVGADPEGKRRAQFLSNASCEMPLTRAVFAALQGSSFLDDFGCADEFHAAIAHDQRLPEAFAAYARRRAVEFGSTLLASLAELESALIVARRRNGATPPTLKPGQVALSPRASVCELARGTFEYAAAVRQMLDDPRQRQPCPPPPPRTGEIESILLLAALPASRHRPSDVDVERLEPLVARLLALCARPTDRNERAQFALANEIEADEVERFVDTLAAEGVLAAG